MLALKAFWGSYALMYNLEFVTDFILDKVGHSGIVQALCAGKAAGVTNKDG